jgi:hypothetical protein
MKHQDSTKARANGRFIYSYTYMTPALYWLQGYRSTFMYRVHCTDLSTVKWNNHFIVFCEFLIKFKLFIILVINLSVLCLVPFPVFVWGPPGLLATGSCCWVVWGLRSLNAAFPCWLCCITLITVKKHLLKLGRALRLFNSWL